jgi:uncharacterized protein
MKSFAVFVCIWILTVILMAVSSPALFYLVSETILFAAGSNPGSLAFSTQLLHFPSEHDYLPAQSELGNRYADGIGVEKDTALGIKWLTQAAAGNNKQAIDKLSSLFWFDSSEAQRSELLKSIKKAAEKNSVQCQKLLSFAYLYGLGTSQDLPQAFFWCKEAANQNDALSQAQLASFYEFGLGADKDKAEEFAWEDKAAKQGVTSSQVQMASDFLNGVSTARHTQEGLTWLEKAAQHGNCRAQTLLGLIYRLRLYQKNDDTVAAKYLSDPIKQKSSVANYLMYLTVPKNSDGVKQLQNAAARGDAHAAATLADMYAIGCGTKLSMQDAIGLYKKAAANGDSDAQVQLGLLYTHGAVDGKPNFEKAEGLFEQASDAGNAAGMNLHGRHELTGIGCQINRKKAIPLIRKAAQLGNIDAIILYTAISQNDKTEEKEALSWLRGAGDKGDVIAQDLLRELDLMDREKWLKLSCEQGYGPALRILAEKKIVGISEKKDTPGGIKILQSLSQAGDSEATISLAEDYRFGMFDTPEDKNKAAELFEKAAMRGNGEAQSKLADMYRLSELGDKRKDEACKWYEKAASQGDQDAQRKLKQYCDKGKLKWSGDN